MEDATMNDKKKHTIKSACPQCGCSHIQNMNKDKAKEKYGHIPNIDLDCHECLTKVEKEKQQ